jgi:hypothetical protein
MASPNTVMRYRRLTPMQRAGAISNSLACDAAQLDPAKLVDVDNDKEMQHVRHAVDELEGKAPEVATVAVTTDRGTTEMAQADQHGLVGRSVQLPGYAWQGCTERRKFRCNIEGVVAGSNDEYILMCEGHHYVFVLPHLKTHFNKAPKHFCVEVRRCQRSWQNSRRRFRTMGSNTSTSRSQGWPRKWPTRVI